MSVSSSQRGDHQPSSVQIRAARSLLRIPTEKLAEMSGVGCSTIRRFEEADGIPPSRSAFERVKAALEGAGIEFIGDPVTSPGVRLRRSEDFPI